MDHILSELSTITSCLGWPYIAWLSFTELDKAVVHVIRLANFLWLWFQSVCPLSAPTVLLERRPAAAWHWSSLSQRGDTPCPRSGAAAKRRYPTSKVRSGACDEIPYVQGKRNPNKTVSKFGKPNSGHRIWKDQSSFQLPRREVLNSVQTTGQLHSSPRLVRLCSKSCMLGFSITITKNF